jgi:thioredoxin 1
MEKKIFTTLTVFLTVLLSQNVVMAQLSNKLNEEDVGLVNIPIPDINQNENIDPAEIEEVLRKNYPDSLWLHDVTKLYADGRVILGDAVALVDKKTWRLRWVSGSLYYPIYDFYPDGRVSTEHPGIYSSGSMWFVLDMNTGWTRFSTKNFPFLSSHPGYQHLFPNGLLIGSEGIARVDMTSGNLLWVKEDLAEQIGEIVDTTQEGLILGEREAARLNLANGNIQWITTGLSQRIGTLRQIDPDGRVSGREGIVQAWTDYRRDSLIRGIARLDLKTGKIIFTNHDISERQREALNQLGIKDHLRFYSSDFIEHIIDRRRRVAKLGKRPIVLVIYPEVDLNAAFQMNNIDDFANQYDVLYYEISNESQFYQVLEEIKPLRANIKVVIIGGHSTRKYLSFGENDPRNVDIPREDLVLDFSDRAELSNYSGFFRDSIVIVDGCSTGAEVKEVDSTNIANLLSQTIARGAEALYAPKSIANSRFEFSSNGSFIQPRFFYDYREVEVLVISSVTQSITDKTFAEEVLESNIPVLVEFYAPWCPHCRNLAPVVDEIAEQYADRVKVVKLNTDENPNTASQYRIRSIPTLMLFKDGQKVDMVVGAVPKQTLVDFLEKYLEQPK